VRPPSTGGGNRAISADREQVALSVRGKRQARPRELIKSGEVTATCVVVKWGTEEKKEDSARSGREALGPKAEGEKFKPEEGTILTGEVPCVGKH